MAAAPTSRSWLLRYRGGDPSPALTLRISATLFATRTVMVSATPASCRARLASGPQGPPNMARGAY